MNENERRQVYGPWARFLRAMARIFLYFWEVDDPCESPCVYVVHHRNMFGPIHSLLLLRDTPRPWVLAVFLDRQSCFDHYYHYTFTQRFGWPRFAAYMAAGVLSWVVPGTLRSFGAIPVYRDLHRTKQTMRDTVEALLRGESVLLCPDVAYESRDAATGKIYKGFFRLDKPFREHTGRPLRFIPVFCSRQSRIVTGEAVCCSESIPLPCNRALRDEAARKMVESLNALAAQAEREVDKPARFRRQSA